MWNAWLKLPINMIAGSKNVVAQKRIYTEADVHGAVDIINLIKSMTGDDLYVKVHNPDFVKQIAQTIADARRRTAADYRANLREFYSGVERRKGDRRQNPENQAQI